jgi:hypothetical protein
MVVVEGDGDAAIEGDATNDGEADGSGIGDVDTGGASFEHSPTHWSRTHSRVPNLDGKHSQSGWY